ncbi:MAG: hypothetical protein DHS20C15_05120 [Planctomycetota bacterium]|nr:MAG: hypothetical protein DHS20C15_05120 [Planctomycetota bacterium]
MSIPALCFSLALILPATAQEAPAPARAPDTAAIERAVLDYAEAYYEVRPDYAERSISKQLDKLGFDTAATTTRMDYAGFLAMVNWFQGRDKPAPGPKQVEILHALDRTALVKLTGSWGVDYMQLTRSSADADGVWQTRHVIWEATPLTGLPELSDDEQRALHVADRTAVQAVVNEYLLAFYDAQPERLTSSMHTDLVKYGFWRDDESGDVTPFPMTLEQARSLAASFNASGWLPDDAPRSIEVLDLRDRIACVKLEAVWGFDYMHLVKLDGRWQILQVLWQSAPLVPAD